MKKFFEGLKNSPYSNWFTKATNHSLFIDDIEVVDINTLNFFQFITNCSLDDLYYLLSNISISIHHSKLSTK